MYKATGASIEEQEKLSVLISNYSKLEESRKDYIRELTKKLAEIHCGMEFLGKHHENEPELPSGIADFIPA